MTSDVDETQSFLHAKHVTDQPQPFLDQGQHSLVQLGTSASIKRTLKPCTWLITSVYIQPSQVVNVFLHGVISVTRQKIAHLNATLEENLHGWNSLGESSLSLASNT